MKHALLVLALTASPAFAGPAITLSGVDSLQWETTPLSGDRRSEPYFAMVRLPAGTVSPAHVKSATMFGVMIEGEMTHAAPGTENPAIIGPGGYYQVPANLPHVSACVSLTPCVTMFYQDGAFDFVPVDQ
jgi:quercetin dioxygenase-like cupin family protein